MRAFLISMLILLWGTAPQEVDVAFMASELKLARSEGRVWVNPAGYLAKLVGPSPVVGEFTLPEPLKPGKYSAFVKGNNGGNGVVIQFTCGKRSSPEFCPQDGDGNGLWSDAVPLEIDEPAKTVTLTFKPSAAKAEPRQFILSALYLTSREGMIVDRSDRVVPRVAPPVLKQPPEPSRGNLVPNGSFETGLGQGWAVSLPNERRDYGIASLWDESRGSDGGASVRIPASAKIISRVFRHRSDRRHTLSVRARADGPSATLTLTLVPANPVLTDSRAPVTRWKKTVAVSSDWRRLDLTEDPDGSAADEVQVMLTANEQAVWIDELQLVEGDPSEFRTRRPVEVGFRCDAPANLFFDDERATIHLLTHNSAAQPFAGKVGFEIYDYLDRRVKTGSVPVSVSARSTMKTDLEIGTGARGIFRIVAWVEDRDGTDEEVSFAVVPRPRVAGPDRDSMIGIHATSSDFQYEVLKKMGVKWQRVLSPEAWFRWRIAEPAPGKLVWFDEEARKAVQHGFETLGTLGSEWPKWADRDGRPDLEAWEKFVRATVAHYKPWVHYWEVWNEPIHNFPADFYADLYQRAARAIRETDPSARIVGLGGSYKAEWCVDVLRRLGGDPAKQMDFMSTHLYPAKADPLNPLSGAAAKEFHDRILVPHKMEIWNTESGAWCLGFERGDNSGFRSPGPTIWPQTEAWRYYRGGDYEASRVACNFLQSIGNGFSKFFYYDSRFHSYHSAGRSHCTIFGVGDTIRAKGVAYAMLAHLFDHSKGLGDVSPSKEVCAFLFDRQGTPLAGLFMTEETDLRKRKAMTLKLDPLRFRALDLMGNEVKIDGSTVPFGRQPVYLEGRKGLTLEELRAAIAGARIADVADAIPPRISLSEGPRGVIHGRSARFRWIATDETSIPYDAAAQSALLYSIGLDGEWSPWTARTTADYAALKPGRHRFEVKARDLSGNVSEVVARDFAVSD